MTKVYERIAEMLSHVLPQNPNADELVLLLSYEDHLAHEAEMKKTGTVVPLDEVFAKGSRMDVVTLYGGRFPTVVIKKKGLLWMAQRSIGDVVDAAKRSRAAPGDVRDDTQATAAAFNDIVLARGNRIGPRGEVLVG